MNYGGCDQKVSQVSFLKQVDEGARLMCVEMGCDPDSVAYVDDIDADKVVGLEFKPFATAQVHNPGVAPPYFIARTPYSGSSPTMPLWRMLRPAAAKALAGWRAVHKWALVGETA